MNNDYTKPLYIQLKNSIKDKIINGEYPIGSFIPSERTMSVSYGINRMTVRKSIKCLVDEGLLRNIHGKGNMVIASHGKIALGKDSFGSLGESVLYAGLRLSREVLSVEVVEGLDSLGFKKDEKVLRLIRKQYADGVPYAYQIAHMPLDLFPDFLDHDFAQESLYEYRVRTFSKPTYCDSTLSVIPCEAEIAEKLQIPAGKKVYYLTYDTSSVRGKRRVEVTMSWQIPGSSSFVTEVDY